METQYDSKASHFTKLNGDENQKSTLEFFEMVIRSILVPRTNRLGKGPLMSGQVLDIGCGPATDAQFYRSLGLRYWGIDSSVNMCKIARKNPHVHKIGRCDFTQEGAIRHFSQAHGFDVVVSKWALQTASDLSVLFREVHKNMWVEGRFIFLVVHPLRQWLEKVPSSEHRTRNYFEKTTVASHIFNKQLTVYEPSHTVQEYIGPSFLEFFELLEIREGYEFPAAEQIGGEIYPTYLIVSAKKKEFET